MDKSLLRKINLEIVRLNAETYMADGKEMTYTELVQWFKDKLLEK